MTTPKTYRKKPIVITASLWFAHGDHPDVHKYSTAHPAHGKALSCCERKTEEHGWVSNLEGGHIVCPGDWIITGIQDGRYPCKPDIFAATYDEVEAP